MLLRILFRICFFLVSVIGIVFAFVYFKTGHVSSESLKDYMAQVAPGFSAEKNASERLLNDARKLINKTTDSTIASPSDSKVKMYKWKDAKGVVHFDNHPVKGAEEINVDTHANAMPADVPSKNTTNESSNEPGEQEGDQRTLAEKRLDQMLGR